MIENPEIAVVIMEIPSATLIEIVHCRLHRQSEHLYFDSYEISPRQFISQNRDVLNGIYKDLRKEYELPDNEEVTRAMRAAVASFLEASQILAGMREPMTTQLSSRMFAIGQIVKSHVRPDQRDKYLVHPVTIGQTTSEIVGIVMQYEPHLISERAKIVGSVSAILSTKSKEGGIFEREMNQRGENVYSLKQETSNNIQDAPDDLPF